MIENWLDSLSSILVQVLQFPVQRFQLFFTVFVCGGQFFFLCGQLLILRFQLVDVQAFYGDARLLQHTPCAAIGGTGQPGTVM